MPRLDTRLECVGAEFLVLGWLLIERIPAFKHYTNMPGYDIVATNPDGGLSARIEVKSGWYTNSRGFRLGAHESDFVVFCRLNRGSKNGKREVREPEFYVIPTAVAVKARKKTGWKKTNLRDIDNVEQYRNAWQLIKECLDLK